MAEAGACCYCRRRGNGDRPPPSKHHRHTPMNGVIQAHAKLMINMLAIRCHGECVFVIARPTGFAMKFSTMGGGQPFCMFMSCTHHRARSPHHEYIGWTGLCMNATASAFRRLYTLTG